jgi:hypothetical protein
MKLMKRVFFPSKTNLLAIGFVFAGSFVSAQPAALDSVRKKFEYYRINHSSEKIYAHIDQELYLTGETLWFKLYVVDGSLHKPIDISKVVYLEILDKDNHAVLQTKVDIQNGFGSGSLFLPASIPAGIYTVRAYTNWMKNFSPDFYFHKSITIINTFKRLEIEKLSSSKFDAQFFPEGGNLVYGLNAKVAFRVTNTSGKGANFRGVLVNQQNDTIASFTPLKFGLGSFDLTPIRGQEYRAIIEAEGQRNTFKIPPAIEYGYALRVKDSTENLLSISIQSNLETAPTIPAVYVFIHARNMVSRAAVHFLQQGKITLAIPKNELQEGISHITLFDSELRPVCERLYFMPVKNKLMIEIQPSQREFGLRRKITLDITTQNVNRERQASNVSVAVFRLDSLLQKTEGNMVSYLWLTSDLAGSIESPEYFINSDDPEVNRLADHVMLTHGWRRFTWDKVLNGLHTDLAFIPEYRGHVIQGKVTNPSGSPVSGIKTFLSSPGRNIQVYGSFSDARGEVHYEMKDFSGPRKIIAQTHSLNDSTSRIQIQSPFSNKFSTRISPSFYFSPAVEKQLISRSIAMQVQDIFYQEKGNQFRSPTTDTTAFYGKADATYYLDDYTRFPVMEEVMREYVPGILVRKRKDGFHFIAIDNVNKAIFDEDPLVLLDGIPVVDIDDIMAFDPLKIKKLEVLTRRYYLGILSLPGIVSYTTYAGDLAGYQLDPKSIVLDYEGLQLQREFYSPKYDTPKQRESRLPDQRSLLYWAPDIITNKDGKQQVEFYSADGVGEYKVVIEGLTKEGLSGSGTSIFSVRPYEN